jgi:hypothetical protein
MSILALRGDDMANKSCDECSCCLSTQMVLGQDSELENAVL